MYLLEILEEVYEIPVEGKAVDVLYLDFVKAFDKAPNPYKTWGKYEREKNRRESTEMDGGLVE